MARYDTARPEWCDFCGAPWNAPPAGPCEGHPVAPEPPQDRQDVREALACLAQARELLYKAAPAFDGQTEAYSELALALRAVVDVDHRLRDKASEHPVTGQITLVNHANGRAVVAEAFSVGSERRVKIEAGCVVLNVDQVRELARFLLTEGDR